MNSIEQIDQSLSIVDKCKVVFQTIHDLLMDKKLEEVTYYMISFVDGVNSNYDDLTQINLLKSILVITKNYPDENIKLIRDKVKNNFSILEQKFKN